MQTQRDMVTTHHGTQGQGQGGAMVVRLSLINQSYWSRRIESATLAQVAANC